MVMACKVVMSYLLCCLLLGLDTMMERPTKGTPKSPSFIKHNVGVLLGYGLCARAGHFIHPSLAALATIFDLDMYGKVHRHSKCPAV